MKKSLLMFGVSLLFAQSVCASDEITIYNKNLALLKKSKDVYLSAGVNDVVFEEVAKTAIDRSVLIYGNGFKVLEQSLDFKPINYMNLLRENVGNKVKTLRINKASGEKEFDEAVLLATDGVNPVLKFDYGIETRFDGEVLFDNVPVMLSNNPLLKAKIEVDNADMKSVNLAYLANGFEWKANYVAKIKDAENLELLGRVVVNNHSGSDYEDAKINLMAGEVNTVKEVMPRLKTMMVRSSALMMEADGMANSLVMADSIEPESLNGFYLYSLPFNVSLKDGETKMVSFLDEKNVKYKKDNVLFSDISFGVNKSEFKNHHPDMTYKFKNVKDEGLGVILAEGQVSFYDEDKNKSLQFIGEDKIKNVAKGEEFELNLGKNFDVFVNGKIKDMQKISERKYKKNPSDRCITVESMYLYDVAFEVINSGKYQTMLVLKQPLYNDAKIVKESIKGEKGEGNIYQWKLDVKPDEKVVLDIAVKGHLDVRDCM